ncbi:MAG: DUF4388 domain-containing protein [Syntrophobacteraceae bacterium]
MDQSQPKTGFSGSIDLIQLADLIQLNCLAGTELAIDVQSESKSGLIFVRSGQIPHAEAGDFVGEDALFEMLRWKGGRFETSPLPENTANTIKRGWEYLLIEAMRRREEQEGLSAGSVAVEGVLSLDADYGFSGAIQHAPLADLIQLCCIAPMDRMLQVEAEEELGKIFIRSGQVRHAQVAELEGQDAIFKILGWPSGRFVVSAHREGGVDSITVPWDALLFESMRRQDEAAHPGEGDEGEPEGSLFQKVQSMKIVEKLRLAMQGDKEARALLIREPSKIIQMAIISNPRITEGEVAVIAHSKQVDEEVLRRIAASREWTKLYPIRMALTTNPKTPLPISIKLVQTLLPQDLKLISKSKAVPTAIAQAARKLVTTQQR